ncbi:peptidoglycan DD-metalloendopeptidase family protein, partial [Candidatus Dojkabacteria bacterium]|nr:peptidoglycan DD-metalloendopeptidase family protein [Candidatus Dojkabacteria bacterium]
EKLFREFSDGRYKAKSDSFREGENKIRVDSVDRAGNSSSSEIKFDADWTPPLLQDLKLITDKDTRTIKLKIHGRGWQKAYIYNLAGIHKVISIEENPVTLVTNWTGSTQYSFYAVLEDKAGNRSAKSRMVTYTTPEDENPEESLIGKGAASYLNSWEYSTDDLEGASCHFNFFIHESRAQLINCSLPSPILDEVDQYSYDRKLFFIEARGRFSDRVKIDAKAYNCKRFSWDDPDTWFKCKVVYVGKRSGYIDASPAIMMYVNEHKQPQSKSRGLVKDKKFVTSIFKETDHHGADIQMRSVLDFDFYMDKEKQVKAVGSEYSPYSNMIEVPEVRFLDMDVERAQYFRFPFNEIVGVTQWYGEINSGMVHRGIDFGSYKKKVYAMNDGYIKYAGWDSHSTDCLSGGNVVLIKHDNGLYSLYAHMEDYKNGSGHKWRSGDRIRRGDRVGKTGNSGFFGCKPLGYHLHLEVRENSRWSSHVNPKNYIDIDWDKVPEY